MKPEQPHPKDRSVSAYFQRKLRGPRNIEYFWHNDITVVEPEEPQDMLS